MKVIWKFPLVLTDEQIIPVPSGKQFLCAQVHNGVITLWARVETTAPQEYTAIRIYGTGDPIPDEDALSYIGTVQYNGYIWHVFELLAP